MTEEEYRSRLRDIDKQREDLKKEYLKEYTRIEVSDIVSDGGCPFKVTDLYVGETPVFDSPTVVVCGTLVEGLYEGERYGTTDDQITEITKAKKGA